MTKMSYHEPPDYNRLAKEVAESMEDKGLESQETITFGEFRAWLTGLIRGKHGVLPDLEDWKMIKKMMDKVNEEPKIVPVPVQPNYPLSDPWNERPWAPPQSPSVAPNTGQPPYTPPVIWCSGNHEDAPAQQYGDMNGTYGDISGTYTITNSVTGDSVETPMNDVDQAFGEFFAAHEALRQMQNNASKKEKERDYA